MSKSLNRRLSELAEGDPLTIFARSGRQYEGLFGTVGTDAVYLQPTRPVHPDTTVIPLAAIEAIAISTR